jgi:hypothetical protein
MKFPLLIIPAVFFLTGCANVHHLDSTRFDVISVPEGMKDSSRLEQVQQRISKGEPAIFKVAKDQQMPFKLNVDLPMGSLEKSESTFTFKQDTWLLMSRKKFQLSPDGQRWANITNRRSLAKLFGFKHGEFSFGFTAKTNESPFMYVDVKVK